MLIFSKKDTFLMRGTHAREVEELDYGIKTEEDRIAAHALGNVIAACTAYKMAVERSRVALDNADLPPQKIGEWTRHLKQDEKSIAEMGVQIKAQIAEARVDVAQLSDDIKAELAEELGLTEPPAQTTEEDQDITAQLLQEDTPEARAKKKRKELKQRKKEAGKDVKNFLQVQEARGEKLAAASHVEEVKKRTEMLESNLIPALEQQAKKVVVEKPPEMKPPEAHQQELLLKKLEREMQASSPTVSDQPDIFSTGG